MKGPPVSPLQVPWALSRVQSMASSIRMPWKEYSIAQCSFFKICQGGKVSVVC